MRSWVRTSASAGSSGAHHELLYSTSPNTRVQQTVWPCLRFDLLKQKVQRMFAAVSLPFAAHSNAFKHITVSAASCWQGLPACQGFLIAEILDELRGELTPIHGRFVLGEGIEKREADLAAEVEEQTKAFEKKAAEKAAAAAADESPAAEVAAEAAPAVKVSSQAGRRAARGGGLEGCFIPKLIPESCHSKLHTCGRCRPRW